MRAPRVAVGVFELAQHVAEPGVEIGERLHAVRAGKAGLLEVLADDALADEVDERIRLRIDVVLVQQDLGELQHFTESPGERRHAVGERGMRA